eukprot:13064-Heterococcus_DN1.PRE.3
MMLTTPVLLILKQAVMHGYRETAKRLQALRRDTQAPASTSGLADASIVIQLETELARLTLTKDKLRAANEHDATLYALHRARLKELVAPSPPMTTASSTSSVFGQRRTATRTAASAAAATAAATAAAGRNSATTVSSVVGNAPTAPALLTSDSAATSAAAAATAAVATLPVSMVLVMSPADSSVDTLTTSGATAGSALLATPAAAVMASPVSNSGEPASPAALPGTNTAAIAVANATTAQAAAAAAAALPQAHAAARSQAAAANSGTTTAAATSGTSVGGTVRHPHSNEVIALLQDWAVAHRRRPRGLKYDANKFGPYPRDTAAVLTECQQQCCCVRHSIIYNC